MDSWLVFRRYRVIFNQWTKRNDWSFKWFSKTSFVWSFPHQTRDLECFADRYNIPWNLPTIFHPDLVATKLQMYLLSLCVLLSQQSHLFPICVESTCNDSRRDLHKICRIQRNCQCKWLKASCRAPRTFASFFEFPEKFLFCTDTTGSVGWLDPAPRLRIDDCIETRNCRLGPCDLLLSSHRNLQLEVRLRHCVFCTGPL